MLKFSEVMEKLDRYTSGPIDDDYARHTYDVMRAVYDLMYRGECQDCKYADELNWCENEKVKSMIMCHDDSILIAEKDFSCCFWESDSSTGELVKASKIGTDFWSKMRFLFELLGVDVPPDGTKFDDCEPYVDKAIQSLLSLLQKVKGF